MIWPTLNKRPVWQMPNFGWLVWLYVVRLGLLAWLALMVLVVVYMMGDDQHRSPPTLSPPSYSKHG